VKKIVDKLAWIHIVDKKILSTRSKSKDVYYIPGGKRENNESDKECLIREIKEELCVDLIPDSFEYIGQFEAQAHGQAQGIIVRMTCYSASYQGTMTPDSEIAEMAWFTHSDKYKSSPVDQIIFDWLLEKQLIG
jgi:ADP-ribose pyrophosphatase YjhB (NUDIX family)